MRIVVGRDEKTEVTEKVIESLKKRGHSLVILDVESWPEVARKVGQAVSSGSVDQGVLFCWTGTGSAMAANKIAGVRAALVWDPWIAEGARLWNDANVLVMSSKKTTPETADLILDKWFSIEKPDPEEIENISKLQ